MTPLSSLFWENLARDLEDPQFLREYVTQAIRIAAVDAVIEALDEARVAEGLSKAELARAIGAEPATVRRLFASGNATPNPTLSTLVDVAAALGLRLRLEPLSAEERTAVTGPLRTGQASPSTGEHLAELRETKRRRSAPSA